MIVENQLVKIKWNINNKKTYEPKGYQFTKFNDEFYALIRDIPSTSHCEVKFLCDYCCDDFTRKLNHAHNRNKHYCSDECRERGSNPNGFTNDERLIQSIDAISILHARLGKVPTVGEYDEFAKQNGLFVRRVLQAKTNQNWNELCAKLFNETNIVKKEKDEMMEELMGLKEKLGRTPLTNELKKNGLQSFTTYMRKFNMTFNELVDSLGWETNGNFTAEITKEELLQKYKSLYDKIGRVPLRYDIESETNFPCYSTYIMKFESISNICALLGIKVANQDLNSVGYGISYIDDNGDFCRSIPEMLITNILIKNNIEYRKEVPYKEIIETDTSRRRFDWYLPKYNVCIEYFGMFDEKSSNEIFKKYRKSVEKKKSNCKENNVNLLDLYSTDINDYYDGLMKKFIENGINLILIQKQVI